MESSTKSNIAAWDWKEHNHNPKTKLLSSASSCMSSELEEQDEWSAKEIFTT